MTLESSTPGLVPAGSEKARTSWSADGARPLIVAESPVIFFDGICGLCDRWVDFVLKHDRRRLFRFATLQGETAREWLQIAPDQPLSSVVLVDDQGAHLKSDAIGRMLTRLGGLWTVPGWLLRCIPRPLRNWGYDLVARHRYRWFGKKETCRLPTPDERSRFLP
ncbi:MAG: DUF393 domain-containing protein [Planctomycetaceae bacterium]|nr:DUF393 domain-containing protein [Planctomycetaceae bacterium]